VSGGPRRIKVPNFVKIGRSVAEILRFFEFSRWSPPPSWIFEIAKFYYLLGSRGSRRICVPNFVKIGQSIANILRFFDFSRWRPSATLDSFGAYLDHPQWVLVGLYHSAKFGYDRCSSSYNMNISIFDAFGWKMPIHAPKIGVLWQFDPLNGVQYQRKPKSHINAWVRVISAINLKISTFTHYEDMTGDKNTEIGVVLELGVTQGHWQHRQSIKHIRLPVRLLEKLCVCLVPFVSYYRLFPKIWKRHVTMTTPTQGTVCNPNVKCITWRNSVRNLKCLALAVSEIF